MKKLSTMLDLQQQLNDNTNGEGWENGMTKNGKKIDWRRCIYLEAAELIESYPWKHWKNIDASPDYENIKIEAVDIWHFVLSESLRLYRIEERGDREALALVISKTPAYTAFKEGRRGSDGDYYHEIETVEDFLRSLFCNEPVETLIAKFFAVAGLSGLTLDSLYQLYIGKNILNRFRQDHGYKEGRYIKIWEDREDNVVMQEILEQDTGITPEALYSALEAAYPAT